MARLSRRATLIGIGGLWLAAGVAGAASVVACRSGSARMASLDRLDVALADIRGADRIARVYRAGTAPSRIAAEFEAKTDLVAALAIDCPASRAAAIRARMREDFRTGDVVVADRLVVSRTECLVAALRHGVAA